MIHPILILCVDLCLWLAIGILVSGGIQLSGVFLDAHIIGELTLSRWSFFCIPFLLCFLFEKIRLKENFTKEGFFNSFSFFKCIKFFERSILGQKNRIDFFVYFFLVLAAFIHCVSSWNRYFSFRSGWDLAIYTQACSNGMYSHLRDHTSLMADHFEPVLFLFIPLCSYFNGALVLLFAQSLAPSLGAWGIYKLSQKWDGEFLGKSFCSIGCTFAYLLISDVQTMIHYDFHPYVFSLATIPWMLYFLVHGKVLFFVVLACLHFSLKENTALFLIGLFALLFVEAKEFSKIPRWVSVVGFVLGSLAFLFVMKVVFPWYRGGTDSQYFTKYFPYLGHTMSEFVWNFFTSPHLWLQRLFGRQELSYVGYFVLLFFCLFKRPWFFFPVIPVLFMNTLSTSEYLKSRSFHYDAEVVAWLFSVLVMLWPKLLVKLNPRFKESLILLWSIFVFSFAFKDSPMTKMNTNLPDRQDLTLYHELQKIRKRYAACTLATTDVLVSALAQHPKLSLFNEYSKADTIVVAFPRGEKSWSYTPGEFRDKILPYAQKLERVEKPLGYNSDFLVYSSCSSSEN